MPKMKTNRLAHKKLRVGGRGRVSRARACTSHKSGPKSAKRMRQLRHSKGVHFTNLRAVQRMLPNAGINK